MMRVRSHTGWASEGFATLARFRRASCGLGCVLDIRGERQTAGTSFVNGVSRIGALGATAGLSNAVQELRNGRSTAY